MRPIARTKELLIEEVEGETLVYDLERHKAHCLNEMAEFVWRLCDGENTVSDLVRLAEKEVGVSEGGDLVWLALDRLERARLLDEPPEAVGEGPPEQHVEVKRSRRDVIKKLGRLGIALPLVASIAVPSPASAATLITGADCWGNPSMVGRCCTNLRACNAVTFGRSTFYICNGSRC